jgi:hypothetical protein
VVVRIGRARRDSALVSKSDRRGGWLIVVVVLVLVAAAATVGVIALKGGSSSAGASVLLEPAGSTGTDPFTASVAIGPAVEFPGNVRVITVAMRKTLPSDPKTNTLVATGTAPGLYGGSGDKHVCGHGTWPRTILCAARANT